MNKRTFTADEIARILNLLAGDDPFDLGGGLFAVRMASKDKIVFTLERDGKEHPLQEADPAELAVISAALWEKGKEFLPDDPADLLMPDELRDKPDDPNLEPDPLGLTPDKLRDIFDYSPTGAGADPELARRLATGTATEAEKVEALLTPDYLK